MSEGHERVVVIGGGFGGIEVARALGRAGMPVTVIDRHNYHLFQPLLYQVATAALSPADIAEPIRKILRRYRSVQVMLGEVERIDRDAREVVLSAGTRVPYDVLVLATGATHSYFGHPEWAHAAPGLKTIADARLIRSEILRCFEQAEITEDAAERERLMTFAVVGGGRDGRRDGGRDRRAGALHARQGFPQHPAGARQRPLDRSRSAVCSPRFRNGLPATRRNRLQRLGVTVMLNSPVKPLSTGSLVVGDRTLAVGATIWAAGVAASPAAHWIGVETDGAGRIPSRPISPSSGMPDVFAIGDVALALDEKGKPLPGLAQVAKQEGIYLGRALARRLARPFPPFRYRSRGNTAVIGRKAAVFDFGWWQTKGCHRVVPMGLHSHLPAGRVRAPAARLGAVALALFHLRAGRPVDRR